MVSQIVYASAHVHSVWLNTFVHGGHAKCADLSMVKKNILLHLHCLFLWKVRDINSWVGGHLVNHKDVILIPWTQASWSLSQTCLSTFLFHWHAPLNCVICSLRNKQTNKKDKEELKVYYEHTLNKLLLESRRIFQDFYAEMLLMS